MAVAGAILNGPKLRRGGRIVWWTALVSVSLLFAGSALTSTAGAFPFASPWSGNIARNVVSSYSDNQQPAVLTSVSNRAVTIGIKPSVVSSGSTLHYRVDNRGDTGIAYGFKFIIQRKVLDGAWGPAPFTPEGPWPQVLAHLAAGRVGGWQAVPVPSGAAPGVYRIKKEIRLEGERRFLVGSFNIESGGDYPPPPQALVKTCNEYCLPQPPVAASCPPGKSIDYLAPLRKLPTVRSLPQSGRLPFGPRDLTVNRPAELIAGGGRLMFSFRNDEANSSNRLNWTLVLSVKLINSRGAVVGDMGEQRLKLRGRRSYWTHPVTLGVSVPSKPSFYRSDLTIIRPHQRPESFGQYTRTLPVRYNVALRLDRHNYVPGATVRAWLENHGTVPMTYGPGIYLEAWNGVRWKPIEEEGNAFPPTAVTVGPGAVSNCQRFPLPPDLEAGHYRLEKTVNRHLVRAYFTVR